MREKWELYDESRRKTGKILCRGERIPKGLFHLVADAVFLNSQGQTLIQRRARTKENYPNIWSATGGSVIAGEDTAQGCRREIQEELGFSPDMTRSRVLHTDVCPESCLIRDTFLIYQDVPLSAMRLQPEEVQSARWLLPEETRADERMWAQLNMKSSWKEVFPYLWLESMRIRIPAGVYRHSKGNLYRVHGLAIHSETLEPMVVYQALYGAGEIWTRPARMWQEEVRVNGVLTPRFSWVSEAEKPAEKPADVRK